MRIFTYILFLIALSLTSIVRAQDPLFSQTYASQSYLNPAMIGTSEDARVNMHYRNQWSNLPGAYNTFATSADINRSELHSGFGILFFSDVAGSQQIKNNQMNFIYAYSLDIKDVHIRTGLQFGYATRTIDYQNLLFGSQINASTGTISSNSGENMNQNLSDSYFDMSTGLLTTYKNAWVGIALHHMNRPQMVFKFDETSILNTKLTLHGGFKYKKVETGTLEKTVYTVTPQFIFRNQGYFNQLDLGTVVNYHHALFGIWYRGVPINNKLTNRLNHDSMSFLLGYTYDERLAFGYSYDMTISKLSNATGGSHELSLTYYFKTQKDNRNFKKLPCPKF